MGGVGRASGDQVKFGHWATLEFGGRTGEAGTINQRLESGKTFEVCGSVDRRKLCVAHPLKPTPHPTHKPQ